MAKNFNADVWEAIASISLPPDEETKDHLIHCISPRCGYIRRRFINIRRFLLLHPSLEVRIPRAKFYYVCFNLNSYDKLKKMPETRSKDVLAVCIDPDNLSASEAQDIVELLKTCPNIIRLSSFASFDAKCLEVDKEVDKCVLDYIRSAPLSLKSLSWVNPGQIGLGIRGSAIRERVTTLAVGCGGECEEHGGDDEVQNVQPVEWSSLKSMTVQTSPLSPGLRMLGRDFTPELTKVEVDGMVQSNDFFKFINQKRATLRTIVLNPATPRQIWTFPYVPNLRRLGCSPAALLHIQQQQTLREIRHLDVIGHSTRNKHTQYDRIKFVRDLHIALTYILESKLFHNLRVIRMEGLHLSDFITESWYHLEVNTYYTWGVNAQYYQVSPVFVDDDFKFIFPIGPLPNIKYLD